MVDWFRNFSRKFWFRNFLAGRKSFVRLKVVSSSSPSPSSFPSPSPLLSSIPVSDKELEELKYPRTKIGARSGAALVGKREYLLKEMLFTL